MSQFDDTDNRILSLQDQARYDTKTANMYTYNNIDERWTMIGRLVAKHGTEDEKVAWALCRGDAAEWKMEARNK